MEKRGSSLMADAALGPDLYVVSRQKGKHRPPGFKGSKRSVWFAKLLWPTVCALQTHCNRKAKPCIRLSRCDNRFWASAQKLSHLTISAG